MNRCVESLDKYNRESATVRSCPGKRCYCTLWRTLRNGCEVPSKEAAWCMVRLDQYCSESGQSEGKQGLDSDFKGPISDNCERLYAELRSQQLWWCYVRESHSSLKILPEKMIADCKRVPYFMSMFTILHPWRDGREQSLYLAIATSNAINVCSSKVLAARGIEAEGFSQIRVVLPPHNRQRAAEGHNNAYTRALPKSQGGFNCNQGEPVII